MPPNATTDISTQPEPAIVQESKSDPVENNSTEMGADIKVFDFKEVEESHEITDTVWWHKALYRLLKEEGSPIDFFKKGEMKSLMDAGRYCVRYPFFQCSKAEFYEADSPPKNKNVIRLVFDSEDDFEVLEDAMQELHSKVSEIELILRLKNYDEYLYDVCKLISPNWFRDRDNMWGFTRMVYQMQGDSGLYRRTYAVILAHQFGKSFNEKSSMTSYDLEGPETKYRNKITISSLKAVAGGSNPDGYRVWKAKHEPEPAKIEKAKAEKDSKKKLSVIVKEQLIAAVKGVYRREFGTGVIYKQKTDYYYTRAFRDPKEFLNEIFGAGEKYHMCSQNDHKELLHFIKDIAHPDFPFMKIDYDYMGFRNGVYSLKTAEFLEGDAIPKNIQVRVYYDSDWVVLEETPLLDKYFSYQFDEESIIRFIYFILGRTLTRIKDKYDFMVMLVGIGGSGKSLLVNLISHAFGAGQVGTLGASFQDRYGLSEFADKQIVISDDSSRS